MTQLPPSRKISLALVFLAFAGAPGARAQEATLELDPARTQISLTRGDALHTVQGAFKLKRGLITFDTGTGKAGGPVGVGATRGDSGSHARDHKMHKDVLESAEYPEITFAPQQVQGAVPPRGDFKVQVLRTFWMHGARHPLRLVIQSDWAGDPLTTETSFGIPYLNWGRKNPSTFFLRVNDGVVIAIHAVSQIKPLTAAPTAESINCACLGRMASIVERRA